MIFQKPLNHQKKVNRYERAKHILLHNVTVNLVLFLIVSSRITIYKINYGSKGLKILPLLKWTI